MSNIRKIIMLVLIVAALFAAYNRGIQHAITNAELYILEISSDDPIPVYIELDGNVYEHELYVG